MTATPMLDLEFQDTVRELCRRSKEECRYNPSRFLAMVTERGAVETAKSLLLARFTAEGFTVLWLAGRLELSIEHEVLDPRWNELFTDEHRKAARKRLEDFGYRFESAH